MNLKLIKLFLQIIILEVFFIANSMAVVPIQNINDASTMITITSQIGKYLQQLQTAQNTYQQVQALKGLQQIQAGGQGLCALCNQTDAVTLSNYVNQINNDLCSQFSNIMSNLTNSQANFSNLQQIISAFNHNPEAASIGLQQTSTSLLSNVQSTLTQMNALQAQQIQRDLAKEKMNKQGVADWHAGFNNMGY